MTMSAYDHSTRSEPQRSACDGLAGQRGRSRYREPLRRNGLARDHTGPPRPRHRRGQPTSRASSTPGVAYSTRSAASRARSSMPYRRPRSSGSSASRPGRSSTTTCEFEPRHLCARRPCDSRRRARLARGRRASRVRIGLDVPHADWVGVRVYADDGFLGSVAGGALDAPGPGSVDHLVVRVQVRVPEDAPAGHPRDSSSSHARPLRAWHGSTGTRQRAGEHERVLAASRG